MVFSRPCLALVGIVLALQVQTVNADLVSSALAGSSISGLIDQIKGVADSIIHELDDKVGLNAFRIRQDLAILISELNNAALELEGKTISDLNSTQKSFFQQAEASIIVAQSTLTAPLEELGNIQVQMSDTISGLPFSRKTARVLQVEPHYLESTFYGSVDSATLENNVSAGGVKASDILIKDIMNPAHIKEIDDILKQVSFAVVFSESTPSLPFSSKPPSAPEAKTFVNQPAQPASQVLRGDHANYSGQFQDELITIKGSDLNYGPASLIFGDTSCVLGEQLDSRLTFNCPGRSFIANQSIERRSGDLVVTDFQPWYSRLWAWVTNDPLPTRTYKTLITIVPQKLGDYSVMAVVETPRLVREPRSQPVAVGNSHCDGERNYNVRVNKQGDPNWSIDFNSVNLVETSGNQGRSVTAPLETGPTGFVVAVNLQNGGSCGPNRPFSGDKLWYDARAWFSGNVSWNESKTVKENLPTVVSSGPLFWGKDMDFVLPDGTKDFQITINQVNNLKQIVIGEEIKPWFRVKSDASKKLLVISPKTIKDAMQ